MTVLLKVYSIFKSTKYLSVQRASPSAPRRMWEEGLTPTDWEIYLGLSINTKPNKRVTKTTNSL